MSEKYKEYKYSEKDVKISGWTYKAVFPEKHSTVDGLIYHSYNTNAGDSWANIPNWQVLCFVLQKGKKEWKCLYGGPASDFPYPTGIYPILFALESKKVREKFLKKKEVSELKKEIREKSKRLEVLLTKE